MQPPRLNIQTYSVLRTTTEDPIKGRRVDGSTSTFDIRANVQPANGKDLKVLPEARHADDIRVLYTGTELYTTRPGFQPDVVTIAGFLYEVFKIEAWPSHYRCYVAATGEAEPEDEGDTGEDTSFFGGYFGGFIGDYFGVTA